LAWVQSKREVDSRQLKSEEREKNQHGEHKVRSTEVTEREANGYLSRVDSQTQKERHRIKKEYKSQQRAQRR
jgi:hypothetical protein